MDERILITGGAGFVGSHLANKLVEHGYRVRVLDSMEEQVHGQQQWPSHLHPKVERMVGDVRDAGKVRMALKNVGAVFHFAAAVGVGQSMYQISRYTDVNNLGSAVLLEALAQEPVKKLVVASSMSVYGEGLYRDAAGNTLTPAERSAADLQSGRWEIFNGDEALQPVATAEDKPIAPSSIYALSKYDQERMCLMIGAAYSIPTTALRFFNIYGPHQSLSNPYTGVLAIFASRYLNGKAPIIFEDGHQRRDFVSVFDVVRACIMALESSQADGEVFNIGSGESHSILSVAERMGQVLQLRELAPHITGQYRVGDIRHCFASILKARRLLRYEPLVDFNDGLQQLADWLRHQQADDRVEHMYRELASRGLSR